MMNPFATKNIKKKDIKIIKIDNFIDSSIIRKS